jgi:signal transduction histidine kinase/DNA-binding NarL/FixJ family response regulator
MVMAVIAASYLASVGNDFPSLGGSASLGVSLASRGLLVVAAGVVLVLLRRAEWPRQQDRAFHLALVATAIFTSAVHLTKIPSGQIQGPFIAGCTLLGLLYFAQRGPIVPRALVGCVITIVGVTLLLVGNHGEAFAPAGRVMGIIALVVLHVIGVFSARAFEEQRRRRFEAERHERHARQELAVKLRELAAEKERVETLSQQRAAFVATMSHEFRTPMNAVIGLSDLLLDAALAPEHQAHVCTINDTARALLGLLEDILDFSRIDAKRLTLSPAPFDLGRLATSVVEMLRPAAGARSLELSLVLSPDVPPHLLGDNARLRQVLVNLVSNAVKFTERGAVTLRIAARPLGGGVHEIACRVEDTGIGMAPKVIARLFRPFEQADSGSTRRYGGTGLGLAISKQIVTAMGGDIHVESAPGRGSVFSFALRLAAAGPRAGLALEARLDRPALAILVVDDNPVNREVARGKLGRLGYAPDLASSGAEAVEAVEKRGYDVVFMDLHMPGMSGIQATARIGERLAGRRAPHVVAMTASVFDEDREACRKAGMHDFIGKPIELSQVDAVLRRVAEERAAAATPAPPAAALSAETLAQLHDIESLGEPRFFEDLCRIFLTDTRSRIPRIKDALARGDAPELAREAHPLRSASASLGALEMSAICARVESAARAGRIEELGADLDAIAAQLVQVEAALVQAVQRGAA